jgi:predicted esterase
MQANGSTRWWVLGPFCDSLRSNGEADFFFTQGDNEIQIDPEHGNFFGPPPNFTFAQADRPDLIRLNLADFPKRDTPEETMGRALDLAGRPTFSNIREIVDRMIGILDTEGDIEGVIGYSEGAMIAGSLIWEEARRYKISGRTPRIKCALFMCGWPPIDPVSGRHLLLDDIDDDQIFTIPTFHVVGAADPFLDGSMALYNMCDPDSADLFDHGGGHTVPRAKQTVNDLAGMVRDMVVSASA